MTNTTSSPMLLFYIKDRNQTTTYAKAFRKAQAKNPELSSTSGDTESGVEESEITQIQFYPDTGAVAQQMTAFEVSLYTDTEEELDG